MKLLKNQVICKSEVQWNAIWPPLCQCETGLCALQQVFANRIVAVSLSGYIFFGSRRACSLKAFTAHGCALQRMCMGPRSVCSTHRCWAHQ